MISYVENKEINWKTVKKLMCISGEMNYFSNFGPVSRILEKKIHYYLNLDNDRAVIVCSSGTSAIHALVEMYNYIFNRKLIWVTSSFTFPCNIQGPLRDAIIVDCDARGMMPVKLDFDFDFDGLIVTDLFGMADRQPYFDYCSKYKKILIVDSAMGFDKPRTNPTDEMISFHHTKPWGFGEGGCVIISRERESLFRSIINFGLVKGQNTGPYSNNAKMSDVSSAFIIQRLEVMPAVKKKMQTQYKRIKKTAKQVGFECEPCPSWTPPCVPLFSDHPIFNLDNPIMTVKKYYQPLANTPNAIDLYNRIICVPCHPDVKCSDKEIRNVLRTIKFQQEKTIITTSHQ